MQSLDQQVDSIKRIFRERELPGLETMLQMAPKNRRSAIQDNSDFTLASVMLLLYRKNDELYFPLIIRTNNNHLDKHRGQIGLPGGKKEDGDKNDWACALRETKEEIGVDPFKIEYVGQLSRIDIPVSSFNVKPFVGYYNGTPKFKKQVTEVADIIEVNLNKLLNPKIIKSGSIELSNGFILENVPFFQIHDLKIWGATAMILNEFISLIENYES